jgi:hypothetical protein
MQTETKMTVDDVLEQQKKTVLIATIEAIDHEPQLVKVTPFIPGAGPSEEPALRIQRESIGSLVPTGEKKLRRGKHLRVFEIHFAEHASIPIKEAFEHLQTSSQPAGALADGLAHRACFTYYQQYVVYKNGVRYVYSLPVTKCTGPYIPG